MLYTTGTLGEKIRRPDSALSPAYLAGYRLGKLTRQTVIALQATASALHKRVQMHFMHSMTASTIQEPPVDYDEPTILRRLGSIQALNEWQARNGLLQQQQHTSDKSDKPTDRLSTLDALI